MTKTPAATAKCVYKKRAAGIHDKCKAYKLYVRANAWAMVGVLLRHILGYEPSEHENMNVMGYLR